MYMCIAFCQCLLQTIVWSILAVTLVVLYVLLDWLILMLNSWLNSRTCDVTSWDPSGELSVEYLPKLRYCQTMSAHKVPLQWITLFPGTSLYLPKPSVNIYTRRLDLSGFTVCSSFLSCVVPVSPGSVMRYVSAGYLLLPPFISTSMEDSGNWVGTVTTRAWNSAETWLYEAASRWESYNEICLSCSTFACVTDSNTYSFPAAHSQNTLMTVAFIVSKEHSCIYVHLADHGGFIVHRTWQ